MWKNRRDKQVNAASTIQEKTQKAKAFARTVPGIAIAASVISTAASPAYSVEPNISQVTCLDNGILDDERAMLLDIYYGFLASESGTYQTVEFYPTNQWKNWPRALEICYFHSVKPGAMKLYGNIFHEGRYQVSLDRTENMDVVPQKEAEYDAEVARLVSMVEGKTADEKICFFHDYIVQKCVYDYSYTKSRAYDCLVEGISVCNGYAAAFYNLCSAAGLEAGYIAGSVKVEDQGMVIHAWNRVKNGDGEWLYYDITFDDALGSYQYYGLTEDVMGQDHFPEEVI